MKFGSHLYGTDNVHSDLDYKGIFLPTKEQVFLGRVPKSIIHTTGNKQLKTGRNFIQKFHNDYGRRAKLAAENKNVDWKAAYQTREVFTKNTITFPLKEAPFLLKVTQGELGYLTEVAPVLETLIEEVEGLSTHSNLPEKVDPGFWDAFLCGTLETELF